MLSLCPACARYLFLLDCKYLSKLFLWCLVCDATIVCEETYVFDSHCWNNGVESICSAIWDRSTPKQKKQLIKRTG